MSEAFQTQWRKSSTVVGPDHLMYIRGRYHRSEKLGATNVTLFTKNGEWSRQDLTMFQRCYSHREIKALLTKAGFVQVEAYAAKSLGIRGRLAVGRTFIVAAKPTCAP